MAKAYVSADEAAAGADPQWSEAGRVHDWRNHVPDEVRAIWNTFTAEQRKALVAWAEGLALNEEWE